RWRLEADAEVARGPPTETEEPADDVDGAPRRLAERDFELAGLAALVVLSSTYFPFHLGLLAYPWLLFLAGLLAPDESADGASPESKESAAVKGASTRDPHGPGRARALMAVLIVALAVVGTVRFNQARDLLGASRLVAVAEGSILQVAQEGTVPPPLLQRNLALLRRAAEMDPAEVGVPIAEGGHFLLLKRHGAEIRSYERAAELEMRSEVFANLARVYLQTGDRDLAIEAMETAIILDHTQRKVFGDTLRDEKRRRQKERSR
ncbi:MAG: hypothetical protein AAFY88_05175, partial [Acidobacteriota bacterium]